MDEETRKKLEKSAAAFAEAMKPSPAMQKTMEQMSRTMVQTASISRPELTVPRMPPTQQEINDYQSASVLMKALAEEALQWKESLSGDYKPAILAVLYGGIQIHVQTLSQVSFHGIRVEGTMNGAPCSLLAHQSTIQLLCYAEEVTAENPRNPIGFVWDNNRIEV